MYHKEKTMNSWKKLLVCSSLLISLAGASDDTRNVEAYNLNNGIGLKSFDPVSFFPEGGNRGTPGLGALSKNYLGAVYFFSSVANKELFLDYAQKYEPTYGGWCAWAMVNGRKVDIDTDYSLINGDRIHFFVNARAKANFEQDISGNEVKADNHWREMSGEEPRI
jgi:hypothetical protein